MQVDLPIIHRDLKSANLILVAPPPPAGAGIEGITAKVTAAVPKSLSLAWCIWGAFLVDTSRVAVQVTDFGLSKDKELDTMKQTVKMTGCGSSLWMVRSLCS
jgi:serine/threonine protein kinase